MREESEVQQERNRIQEAWEKVWKDYFLSGPVLDVTGFVRLVFDTYEYFLQYKNYNSVLREELTIYKYISAFYLAADEYPENCEHYALDCCTDFAHGLCWAIENDFKRGMHKMCLPLLLDDPDHGGADSEADMSSYETYQKAFRKHMIYFMRMHIEEDELDENEELEKINAVLPLSDNR